MPTTQCPLCKRHVDNADFPITGHLNGHVKAGKLKKSAVPNMRQQMRGIPKNSFTDNAQKSDKK